MYSMAPQRIISWAANPTSTPPIESISSDSSSGHAAQSQVKSMSLPPVLEDKKIGVQRANDDAFTRHNKYYFKDGNITFLVCPRLIIVPPLTLFNSRSRAPFTVFIDTFSHSIQNTSPLGLTSSEFMTTKPFPSQYH